MFIFRCLVDRRSLVVRLLFSSPFSPLDFFFRFDQRSAAWVKHAMNVGPRRLWHGRCLCWSNQSERGLSESTRQKERNKHQTNGDNNVRRRHQPVVFVHTTTNWLSTFRSDCPFLLFFFYISASSKVVEENGQGQQRSFQSLRCETKWAGEMTISKRKRQSDCGSLRWHEPVIRMSFNVMIRTGSSSYFRLVALVDCFVDVTREMAGRGERARKRGSLFYFDWWFLVIGNL